MHRCARELRTNCCHNAAARRKTQKLAILCYEKLFQQVEKKQLYEIRLQMYEDTFLNHSFSCEFVNTSILPTKMKPWHYGLYVVFFVASCIRQRNSYIRGGGGRAYALATVDV